PRVARATEPVTIARITLAMNASAPTAARVKVATTRGSRGKDSGPTWITAEIVPTNSGAAAALRQDHDAARGTAALGAVAGRRIQTWPGNRTNHHSSPM